MIRHASASKSSLPDARAIHVEGTPAKVGSRTHTSQLKEHQEMNPIAQETQTDVELDRLTTTTLKNESPASRRAELLASRIEEGAAGLARFAEGLSEAEWRTPASASDQRSVGVIIHHVASMY